MQSANKGYNNEVLTQTSAIYILLIIIHIGPFTFTVYLWGFILNASLFL